MGLQNLGDKQVPARAKGDRGTGGGGGGKEGLEAQRRDPLLAAPEKPPWSRDPLAAQGEPGGPKSWCCFMELCSPSRKTGKR